MIFYTIFLQKTSILHSIYAFYVEFFQKWVNSNFPFFQTFQVFPSFWVDSWKLWDSFQFTDFSVLRKTCNGKLKFSRAQHKVLREMLRNISWLTCEFALLLLVWYFSSSAQTFPDTFEPSRIAHSFLWFSCKMCVYVFCVLLLSIITNPLNSIFLTFLLFLETIKYFFLTLLSVVHQSAVERLR